MLKKIALAAVFALGMMAATPAMAQSLNGSLNGSVTEGNIGGSNSIDQLSYSSVESGIGGGYAVAGNLQMTGIDANTSVSMSGNNLNGNMNADAYNLNVSGVVSGGNGIGNAEGLSGLENSLDFDAYAASLNAQLNVNVGP